MLFWPLTRFMPWGGLVYLYSGSCFVFLCVLAAVKDKFAEVAQDILLVWAQVYASLGFS